MKNKNYLNILLLLLVTFLVLYFSLRNNFELIINQILTINIYWLIVALILIVGYWYFKSLVLHIYVKKFNNDYTFNKAFRLSVITLFFNAITPFASGGQPFQVYALKKDGLRLSEGTNVIVGDTIIYQMSIVILGIIAIILNKTFNLFSSNSLLIKLVTIGFILNLLVIVILFMISFIPKMDKFILKIVIKLLTKLKIVKNEQETVKKLSDQIENFSIGAKLLLKNKKHFIMMLAFNIMGLICLYLIPLAVIYGMGIYNAFNPLISLVVSSYVQLIGSFIPIPGGTGGLEYSFLFFFKNYVKEPTLMALMLTWRFISYYLGMIIGAITINIKAKKEVKHASRNFH